MPRHVTDSSRRRSRKPFVPLRRGLAEHVTSGRLRASRFAVFVWLLIKADHKTGRAWTSPAQVAIDLGFHPVTVRREFLALRRGQYIRYSPPPGGRQPCEITIAKYHDHFESEPGELQVPLRDRLPVPPVSAHGDRTHRRPKNKEVRSTTSSLRVRSADGTPGEESNRQGPSASPLTREEALSQAPAALRETVEYFLFKTGRESVASHELDTLSRLDAAHTPAMIQKAITRAVDRLRRQGQDATHLTFEYLWQSLQHFTTRKPPPPESRGDPASHPTYPTGVTRLW